MKVLMVTPYPSPSKGPTGGVEAVATALAAGLATHDGVEVHVLRLDRSGAEESEWSQGRVHVHSVPCVQPAAAWTGFSLAKRLVRREYDRVMPDVVHAQGLGPEGIAVASLHAHGRIITPHGHPWWDVVGNRSGVLARAEAGQRIRLAKSALRKVDACIAISAPGANLSDVSDWVVRIDNPIAPVFFEPCAAPENQGPVLIAAAVKRVKRLELVLEAVSELQGREVWVAGQISDVRYHRELTETFEVRGGVKVEWLGQQAPVEMRRLYDLASCLVVASQWEVAPASVAEAMLRCCPVVAPDLPGPGEMIGHGERGWLYRAGSSRDCRQAMLEAIAAGRLDDRVERAHAWATSAFDPERVARQHIGLYESIVERGGRAR